MSALFPLLNRIIKYAWRPRREGDFIDRLNYRLTVTLLAACAVVIFFKDYGGDPLKCWGRAEWRDGWIEYAHDYCFIESTYFVPLNDPRIPVEKDFRRKAQLDYYQWVPFLLLLQALTYLVPERIWKTFNSYSGIDVGKVVTDASDAAKEGGGIDMEKVEDIATELSNAFDAKAFTHNSCDGKHPKRSWIRRRFTSLLGSIIDPSYVRGSLTAIYFLSKLLLIVNSAIQFYFLGYFLGKSNPTFGWDAVDALTDGDDWRDTGLFPRVTLCDFKVRGHRNLIETFTVQCVLMGNMVNEKIFISLWWWMSILDAVTTVNLVQWIFKVCRGQSRKDFVRKSLFPAADLLYPLSTKKEEESEKGRKKKEDESQDENKAIEECAKSVEKLREEVEKLKKEVKSCDNSVELLEKAKEELGKLSEREKHLKRLARHKNDFIKYLGADGVLIMDLMQRNSNGMVVSAVTGRLFDKYCELAEDKPHIIIQFLDDE